MQMIMIFPNAIQENAEAEIQTFDSDEGPEKVNLENIVIEDQNPDNNVLETTTDSGKN